MSFQLSTPVPLSDDSESVLTKTIGESLKVEGDLSHVFEVDRTVDFIRSNNYKSVALQFPDEHLADSGRVASLISKQVDANIQILADTNYGSCCVDEVAAEHMSADAIVHYGRACLSPTSRLPLLYVFGRLPINVDKMITSFTEKFPLDSPILLVSDTRWYYCQDLIIRKMKNAGYKTVIASTLVRREEPDLELEACTTIPGRLFRLPENISLSDVSLVFVGPDSPTLTSILMSHYSVVKAFWSFDPVKETFTEESSFGGAKLRRRYALVQKCRDAGVIGIIVGTLGVSNYLNVLDRLRKMILNAGKKPYILAIGKLNPAKLANFQEIECFVLIACGENSLIDSRDFYRPIVTPFELMKALSSDTSWLNECILSFDRVLSLTEEQETNTEKQIQSDESESPHFSLVTGKLVNSTPMRHVELSLDSNENKTGDLNEDGSSALQKRSNRDLTVNGVYSPAAAYLQSRSWAGLSPVPEGTAPSKLHEGQKGIAKGYVGEGNKGEKNDEEPYV
ncbi:diphthamide biosynthesis protein [Schizosaccharomyces cryophilus OY26]|uniref:2-(3-amino-3-carboxypropyl)histidine synthase subunit 2 n=1 Tax=Schizosaccharomyces cryophilus (strain OY26 / ATCC MYA-4695 / CBS 11777 / NBRC 106824 / NRRL Y48691) TaxID=653667 RepID=S9VXD6_SCHCR|nr:diphthamide biosynthesis protein [Schizosaccharomyces cryophilus OY26]EPY50665.1 diphthamide biosynthesis protein [Schizosaccharomyces cryophilus OY26]